MEIPLLLQRRAPIPSTRQPPINTTTGIEEVIRSRAIKPMSKEVSQDFLGQFLGRSILLIYIFPNTRFLGQGRDLGNGVANREQDAINLRVLVNEEEGVGDVVIAHMDDTRPDPCPDAPLSLVEDRVHHTGGLWSALDTVKALTGISESVRYVFG
jgi:hypothetical protein